ncbi:MAG: excisionase family DNA-binding protein [Gemmatimonadetes bacterium]|nr:helix-turn-helix domain-containing protein [Gemmatimonadota bacterium]NNM03752.1 excisionase family DNA-binding protein [Gemmatimonadota bacterium]
MDEEGSDLLSTGEVARLCGVTRDAVLKWIKKGKLPATQTPGGHFRVPKEACQGMAMEGPHVKPAVDHLGEPGESGPLRCWEYFGDSGSPREVCESCLVYLARAQNCFRLAELGEEAGHRLHFCRQDCRTCAYYRACQGLATEVLLISKDESLVRRLEAGVDPEKVSMRFARSGYEGSAIISTFSPALVVMDSDLAEVRGRQLPESILGDDRIPAARIVVACRKGHRELFEGLPVLKIPAPFTADEITTLTEEAIQNHAGVPRDVA